MSTLEESTTSTRRKEGTDEFARGLRTLASWYEQHPGVDRVPQFDCTLFAIDEDEFFEMVHAIGQPYEAADSVHYVGVARELSANVRLRAIIGRARLDGAST